MLMPAGEPATLRSRRRHFLSVNAKQLARPALQAGPSRCKSGRGYQYWLKPVVHVAQLDSERHRAKVEAAGATPAVDTSLPLSLSRHRRGFINRLVAVRKDPVRIRLVTPISMGRKLQVILRTKGRPLAMRERPDESPGRVRIPLGRSRPAAPLAHRYIL